MTYFIGALAGALVALVAVVIVSNHDRWRQAERHVARTEELLAQRTEYMRQLVEIAQTWQQRYTRRKAKAPTPAGGDGQ